MHSIRPHHQAPHSHLVTALDQYHNDGDYMKDLDAAGEAALAWLKAQTFTCPKPALVLDIDETSLINSWEVVNPANPYSPTTWDDWVAKGAAKAAPKTLELAQYAVEEKGMALFFITGRHPDQMAPTVKNLEAVGYPAWEELILEPRQPDNDQYLLFPEAATYKTASRWSLEQRGYTVVLSVGDQLSDLAGGFARKTFKLPNPFYTVM